MIKNTTTRRTREYLFGTDELKEILRNVIRSREQTKTNVPVATEFEIDFGPEHVSMTLMTVEEAEKDFETPEPEVPDDVVATVARWAEERNNS